jgi:hypothetical protein
MIVKNKLTRLLYILLFAAIMPVNRTNAQFFEGGILIGGSNYIGDLSGKFINIGTTRPAAGILLRYNINQRFTVKGYLGYGRITGVDSLSTVEYHKQRNLSFYSDVWEFSTQLEFNILPYSFKRYAKKPFVPYVFVGIGVFNFNPTATYQGKNYELQPLGTEGQGTTQYNDLEKYTLTQFCIPFGLGVKKRVSDRWTVGLEIGARYTFTNYLDDVGGKYANQQIVARGNGEIAGVLSDRSAEKIGGDPLFKEGDRRSNKSIDVNDIYIFGGISVTFRLKKKLQCPSFK